MHIIVYILSLNILFSFEFIFETNQIDVTQDSVVLEHPFSGGLNRPKIQWIDWDEDGDDDAAAAAECEEPLRNRRTRSAA